MPMCKMTNLIMTVLSFLFVIYSLKKLVDLTVNTVSFCSRFRQQNSAVQVNFTLFVTFRQGKSIAFFDKQNCRLSPYHFRWLISTRPSFPYKKHPVCFSTNEVFISMNLRKLQLHPKLQDSRNPVSTLRHRQYYLPP